MVISNYEYLRVLTMVRQYPDQKQIFASHKNIRPGAAIGLFDKKIDANEHVIIDMALPKIVNTNKQK